MYIAITIPCNSIKTFVSTAGSTVDASGPLALAFTVCTYVACMNVVNLLFLFQPTSDLVCFIRENKCVALSIKKMIRAMSLQHDEQHRLALTV